MRVRQAPANVDFVGRISCLNLGFELGENRDLRLAKYLRQLAEAALPTASHAHVLLRVLLARVERHAHDFVAGPAAMTSE